MPTLSSNDMNLSRQERNWLPWLGTNNKLLMRSATAINDHHIDLVETIFDNLAESRVQQVQDWTQSHWELFEGFSLELAYLKDRDQSAWLAEKQHQVPAFSELFVVDASGTVSASSVSERQGKDAPNAKAFQEGMKAPFLHGPYIDQDTLALGQTTSDFHDAVTLMFYQPLVINDETVGCVCGRLPMDVMSDLIQRESGHIYKKSGDNYIFMADSRFDPSIKPGTALSRSRFEDDSVIAGDNLKAGIKTPFNTVRVQAHTEFEIVFTAPATGELHPGIRETIRNGSNLFVNYPGYSDYRHVPVIGKGITFTLPGSPDQWGMMCEADLGEVYARRSINWRMSWRALFCTGLPLVVLGWWQGPENWLALSTTLAAVFILLQVFVLRPVSTRSESILRHLVGITEGGKISHTLDTKNWANDSMREIALWKNSFSGKVHEVVRSMSTVSSRTEKSCDSISESTTRILDGSEYQAAGAESMSSAVEELSTGIGIISTNSQRTQESAQETKATAARGREMMEQCTREIGQMRDVIESAAKSIQQLSDRSSSIGTIVETIGAIAEQTNLLALNAAIEAARAGEEGRGFAVVADEVRSLAGRTGKATDEIKEMIGGMQTDVDSAVDRIQQCSGNADEVVSISRQVDDALTAIDQAVDSVSNMIQDIADSSEQQGKASNEIAENVSNLAKQAELNHDALGGTVAAVHGLRRAAGQMERLVGRFS